MGGICVWTRTPLPPCDILALWVSLPYPPSPPSQPPAQPPRVSVLDPQSYMPRDYSLATAYLVRGLPSWQARHNCLYPFL